MVAASRAELPAYAEAGDKEITVDRTSRDWRWAALILAGALTPALTAIWSVSWFVPQDSPAHVYNAQILVWSFDPASPFREYYKVNWRPIPNWAGPLTLAGLVAVVPAWVADRIITSLTLVCFAASVVWLRWRVAGTRGLGGAALLAALLAMNMAWLSGFASFMFGACLFPITLGLWWPARDRLRIPVLAALSGLLALGYLCHLVSLGLTMGGLVVLAFASPVSTNGKNTWRERLVRVARTCAAFGPAILLGLYYLSIATQRAPMSPHWGNLSDPWSPRAWIEQFEWADPISLAIRDGLPLTDREGRQFILFAPVIWLAVAIALWWCGTISSWLRPRTFDERRCWHFLAGLLVIGGALGPDTLGAAHGNLLPQRIILLGLVALVPIFDIDPTCWLGRGCAAALAVAVMLQSAIVWDYAIYSNRTAGQIIGARNAVGDGQRIAAILASTRSRFRDNPLLHAVDWLGVDTGNVVWNNYETMHYYFPVQFQPGIDRPLPDELEWVSLHEDPIESDLRSRAWEKILVRHSTSIDVVVEWKSDPALDAVTRRWFGQVDRRGDVQIFRREALEGH